MTSGFGGRWFPLAGLVEVAIFMLPNPSWISVHSAFCLLTMLQLHVVSDLIFITYYYFLRNHHGTVLFVSIVCYTLDVTLLLFWLSTYTCTCTCTYMQHMRMCGAKNQFLSAIYRVTYSCWACPLLPPCSNILFLYGCWLMQVHVGGHVMQSAFYVHVTPSWMLGGEVGDYLHIGLLPTLCCIELRS